MKIPSVNNKNSILLLTTGLFVLVVAGVYINVKAQRDLDRSKLPPKVALSRPFLRWITNLKNKDLTIDADEFRLKESNEIYNTKWLKVYSMDDQIQKTKYEDTIKNLQNTPRVIFSPSGREILDYRNIVRDDYQPNEVHFYGQKEDKIIDAKILTCSTRGNCYFDRAYFLDNDVFVISEISRDITKTDLDVDYCDPATECTYTIKVHVIDLINNNRLIYSSKPFNVVLTELIKGL